MSTEASLLLNRQDNDASSTSSTTAETKLVTINMVAKLDGKHEMTDDSSNIQIDLNSNNNTGSGITNLNSKANEINRPSPLSLSSNNLNYCFRNPNSIESVAVPSPAGSLEQFDVVSTPLSIEDSSETYINDNMKETNSNPPFANTQSNKNSVDSSSASSNNTSQRFRRHSSQSSVNLLPIAPSTSYANNQTATANLISPLTLKSTSSNNISNCSNSTSEQQRICSSPINSLKMSSRVCQIKIDEGIEPHLSREIKSERETQNTLKLKTSCDELMLNGDELGGGSDGFTFDVKSSNSDRNTNNSPNSGTFKRYRTFSDTFNNGNMPSPSMASCYSYSNSSSPTGGNINNNSNGCGPNPTSNALSNSGLLRCFSPSTAFSLNGNQMPQNPPIIQPNYFSQSPSPTRKLFVTRRSMSPIALNLRPSSLNTNNLAMVNNKRKFSDVDSTADLNSPLSTCSPKRSNNDQEFVQPLLININTGNPNLLRAISNASTTSSPSSPCNVMQINNGNQSTNSNNNSKINPSSLVITTQNTIAPEDKNRENKSQDLKEKQQKEEESSSSEAMVISSASTNDSAFIWPTIQLPQTKATAIKKEPKAAATPTEIEDGSSNKYTFVPIQLPPPPPSSTNRLLNNSYNNNLTTSATSVQLNQKKRPTILTTSTNSSFSSLAQMSLPNSSINIINNTNTNTNNNNSPLNSPARYFCDSPISYSPSVSNVSSSSNLNGDKPDSGYGSSAQNNSDSESCI